jgi:spermidine/putrescine-binding protein
VPSSREPIDAALLRSVKGEALSRRQFVMRGSAMTALAAFAPVLAACGSDGGGSAAGGGGGGGGGGGELNYFSWEPWARKEYLAAFEKEQGATVKSAFYSSGQEMLTKLQGGGSKLYDMLSPVNNDIPRLVGAGLAEPFDLSLVPNFEKVIPRFRDYPDLSVDGETYMVPFVWGTDTVAHNKKHIPEVTSWNVLFDKQYKGRLAVQDSAFETIALTAISLGYTDPSPFNITDKQLDDCKKKLIEAKPLWRTIWSNFTDLQNLFISGEVWATQAWLTIVEPVKAGGVDIGWALVDEGSIGWIEGVSIVKGTKNRELVHKFADYCAGPDFMYDVFKDSGYYPATTAVGDKMTPAEKDASMLSNPQLPNKQHYYATPPNMPKWEEVWNEVKAA